MTSHSLFHVKFYPDPDYSIKFLINYPHKSIGFKELKRLRQMLCNNSLEYIERLEVKLDHYVLSLTSKQIEDIEDFQDSGFLHCKVCLIMPYNFNKFLSFEYVYPDPTNLTYAREVVSINNILLFKEWKFAGCPHNDKSINDKFIL